MSTVGSVNVGSISMQLAALREEQRAATLDIAENDIAVETQEKEYQREKQIEAQRRAQKEAEKAGFWEDVASVAKCVAVAGSVAGAAFTGGSSLVVAGAIMGGGLTIGGEVLKRTDVIGDDVATGLQIAGAAVSLGAGAASLFTSASEVASETAVVGGAASRAVSGAGTVGAGGATYGTKAANSAEQYARADVLAADTRGQEAQGRIDDAIARMERQIKDDQSATRIYTRLQNQESEARASLINAVRG